MARRTPASMVSSGMRRPPLRRRPRPPEQGGVLAGEPREPARRLSGEPLHGAGDRRRPARAEDAPEFHPEPGVPVREPGGLDLPPPGLGQLIMVGHRGAG